MSGAAFPSLGLLTDNLGAVTSSQSSTFQQGQEGTFKIKYVDESSASGQYFRDNFQLGGVTVKNLTMGLAEETDIPFGLVGIGYRTNEASIQTVQATYPNLPIAMQSSGNIKTVAYSLWLNDLEANTGSLLFGGIDTEKYQGNLALLDLIPDPDVNQVVEFNVPLTSVAGYSSTGSDVFGSTSYPITALLDSGTTLSYLPVDLTNQIWQEVGAAYVGQIGVAVVPCALANTNSYFSFGFGGPRGPLINVTMAELVLDTVSNLPFPSGKFRGKASCTFGIQAQAPNDDGSAPSYLLGDTFLRSAYVVYDLVNNQVALAQTQANATASNVVPFPSNGATVPSSTLVPGQNSSSNSGPSSTPAYKASGGFQSDAAPLMGLSALGLVAASMATFLAIFASTV